MHSEYYSHLRKQKIYYRMYHSSLVMSIIPLIILALLFVSVFSSVYVSQYSSQEKSILQSYSENRSSELYHFDTSVAAMTQDSLVQSFFNNQLTYSDYDRYCAVRALTARAVDQFHMVPYVTDMALMTNNYQITQIYNGPHNDFYPDLLDVRTLAKKAFYQKSNTFLCDASEYNHGLDTQNSDGILYIRRITDSGNNSINLGYLIAYIDKADFFDLSSLLSKEYPLEQLFIIDPNNDKVIYCSEGSDPDTPAIIPFKNFDFGTQDLSLIRHAQSSAVFLTMPYNINALGWTIISAQPINIMLQTILVILISALALIVIIFLIQSFIARQVAHSIDKPLKRILDSLHRIEQGNFDSFESDDYNDELAVIQNSVNSTALLLKKLFENEREQEKRQYELRFQALMAQTNPHFLMNTINSVRLLASIQGADNISALCKAFINLLQDMLKSDSTDILLADELALVRDYSLIMRYRYMDRFHIDYDIQVPSDSTIIPRFILQPLIENALGHGLSETMPLMDIVICIRKDDDCLMIDVIDNGVGISKAHLDELNSTLDTMTETKKNGVHIGLYNIHQRICILYGDEYGLSIDSEENRYTAVHVKVPFQSKIIP